jgi:hypothetical protein
LSVAGSWWGLLDHFWGVIVWFYYVDLSWFYIPSCDFDGICRFEVDFPFSNVGILLHGKVVANENLCCLMAKHSN